MPARAPFVLLAACLSLACGDEPDGTAARSIPGAEREPWFDHPGAPAASAAAAGGGGCAGLTLGDALARLQEARPDLRAATTVVVSDDGPSGTPIVRGFVRPDGGFSIALRREPEGCVAPCTTLEYLYFETDGACAPQPVGRFLRRRSGTCLEVDGVPRWDVPAAPAALDQCGVDRAPQAIEAQRFELRTRGASRPCRGAPRPVSGRAKISVSPVAELPARALVTIDGTGLAALDGAPWPATIERRRLSVDVNINVVEGACRKASRAAIWIDLEGDVRGELAFTETWDGCGGGCDADTKLSMRGPR